MPMKMNATFDYSFATEITEVTRGTLV
jgi:hypothetical protein